MDRKALGQLIGTGLILAVGCGVTAAYQSRPKNAGQIKVLVSELRSIAAECALLTAEAPMAGWSRAYRRVHLEMTRSSAEQAQRALESVDVQPDLESVRDSAAESGRALVQEMKGWGSADRSVSRRAAFERLSAQLQALESRLE